MSMSSGSTPSGRPGDQQMLNAIARAVQSSNLSYASELADQALVRGIRHPIVFNARALWLQERGRYQDALVEYQRALSLIPHDVTLLNAIGLCLLKLNRINEAIAAFEAAIAIDPNLASAHYRKGWALGLTGDQGAAEQAYELAVSLRPDYPEALANLASIAAWRGNMTAAGAFAERALKLDPHQPTAAAALAAADLAEKKYTSAEQRLRLLLASSQLTAGRPKAVAFGLLADALDGQRRFAEAFGAYTAENEELRRLHAPRFAGAERAMDVVKGLIAYFEAASPEQWKAPHDNGLAQDGAAQHVFLAGFMRSGTTLLEQVLASSPEIVTLEEQEILAEISQDFLTTEEGLNRLAFLDGKALSHARDIYWRRVRERGLVIEGKIFVDKQPLHTLKLPLIAKLFPTAKVLFALRDPRDVVLSCFRRHFEINATMFEFLTLEGAADFYAAVMRLVELYRAKLPLTLYEHRYEDMIESFDVRVRAVCDFIGAEWTDAMRDFASTVPATQIRSPSAAQVKRELYSEGVGAWRNYQDQLAPILPILEPWVEKFGYPRS